MNEGLEELKQRYFSLQRPSDDLARDTYRECFNFLSCSWLGSEKVRGVENTATMALSYLYKTLDCTEEAYLEAIEQFDTEALAYWQTERRHIFMKIGILTDFQRRLAQAKREQESDQ